MHACMRINKYHAVALHLRCMWTLCILGANAQHELTVFLGRLSTKFYRSLSKKKYIYLKVVHIIIGVCPNEKYRRVVQNFNRVCPTNLRES